MTTANTYITRFTDFPTIKLNKWPKIKGMFVSLILEHPASGSSYNRFKTPSQWEQEVRHMATMGIEYIIIQATVGKVNGVYCSLFPSNNFPPYMGDNQQINYIFNAIRKTGVNIKVWLGTIMGLGETDSTFIEVTTKLMNDLFINNKFHWAKEWGGLYLANEKKIVPRTTTYSCVQQLQNPALKNWPNWLEYRDAIKIARSTNAYPNGRIAISPLYRPALTPYNYLNNCKLPPGRWSVQPSEVLPNISAKNSLLNMVNDANCLPLTQKGLTHVWIQDGLGFGWLKDALQVGGYFANEPAGFRKVEGVDIGYNMECFKPVPNTCPAMQATKTWTELTISFRAAYSSGYTEICAYEWFTNWSPATTPRDTVRTNNYKTYVNYVKAV